MEEEEKRFFRRKEDKEFLKDAMESLDNARYSFACFVDSFQKYLKKAGLLND